MPELPEVEVTRQALLSAQGQNITGIKIHQSKLRFSVDEKVINQLIKQTIVAIQRRAKYLIFRLDSQQYLLSHLGMAGHWKICDFDQPLLKHDHVEIELEKFVLRYHDVRRFGFLLLGEGKPENHSRLKPLGLEPLDIPGLLPAPILDSNDLWKSLRNKSRAIKLAIMDSQLLAGVGNIYANESLFMAGIHPQCPANKVSRINLEQLVQCIQQVLKKSIEKGGTTLRDFINPRHQKGFFQLDFVVYGKEGERCKYCDGTIEKIVLGQRGTYYCNSCQN